MCGFDDAYCLLADTLQFHAFVATEIVQKEDAWHKAHQKVQ